MRTHIYIYMHTCQEAPQPIYASTSHGSSKQGLLKVEGGPHLPLDPQGSANQGASENCLVIAALEFEHLDDDQSTEEQVGKLERTTCLESGSLTPLADEG